MIGAVRFEHVRAWPLGLEPRRTTDWEPPLSARDGLRYVRELLARGRDRGQRHRTRRARAAKRAPPLITRGETRMTSRTSRTRSRTKCSRRRQQTARYSPMKRHEGRERCDRGRREREIEENRGYLRRVDSERRHAHRPRRRFAVLSERTGRGISGARGRVSLWLRRTPGTPGLSVPMVNSPPGIETSRGPRSVASLSSVRVDAGDSTAPGRTATSSDTASRLNLSDPHPLRGTRTSDGMCALFGEARCAPLRLLAVLARCRGTGLLLG